MSSSPPKKKKPTEKGMQQPTQGMLSWFPQPENSKVIYDMICLHEMNNGRKHPMDLVEDPDS